MLENSRFNNIKLSKVAVILAIIMLIIAHLDIEYYSNPKKIFRDDIKSYYAYFPTIFIEKDVKMSFMDDPEFATKSFYWRYTNENGDKLIMTSCGMSILYFPFAIVAHQLAPLLGYKANGYTEPYSFAVVLSNFVFIILGLWYFRKLLLEYFSEFITFVVIVSVFFGTNLFHYSVQESAMPHAYEFALGAIFLYFVNKWHHKQSIYNSIMIGLLSGLISLIRPNNVLVLLIFAFWNVGSFNDFKDKVVFFLKKWQSVLMMIALFFIVWAPQFIYWKATTGQYLYYSYGPSGGDFYFLSPNFLNQLFSYRKGAIMYSPILFFAFISIIWVVYKKKKMGIPILIYSIGIYWFLSSWWSWWNGGGFGIRMYIDTYFVLFFSFAFLVSSIEKSKKKFLRYSFFSLVFLLTFFGWFRNYQYANGVIHYDTNTKDMYWPSLFRTKPVHNYWKIVKANRPDYFLARCGIYATKTDDVDTNTYYGCMVTELRAINNDKTRSEAIKKESIKQKKSFFRLCRQKAEEACKK